MHRPPPGRAVAVRTQGEAFKVFVPAPRRPRCSQPPRCWLQREGTAYYLLFNGVLGDQRPASGNVLTTAVLAALHRSRWHAGPKVVYGEACRLGPARLAAEGITFKQLPHAVPR